MTGIDEHMFEMKKLNDALDQRIAELKKRQDDLNREYVKLYNENNGVCTPEMKKIIFELLENDKSIEDACRRIDSKFHYLGNILK